MPKYLNIIELKNNAILKHGNKYSYDNSYYSANTLYNILCYKHGLFNQKSHHHLNGGNCPKCYNRNKTNEDVIKEFNKIHNNRYDYSLIDYKDCCINKLKIICKEHGIFEQSHNNHIKGKGCPVCTNNKKYTNESFIKKAKEIHGDKYGYSLINYINNRNKVKIICPVHGIFEQVPSSHLLGMECSRCVFTKTTEDFIERANKIHNNLFQYKNSDFVSAKTPIKIECKVHGEFEQTPNAHLGGHGCPFCKESRGEKQIRLFLQKNNINYVRQKRFNDCRYKYPLAFDFYIQKYNLCIEFDGELHEKPIEHFGGVEALNENIKRDNIKTKYCLDNNIKLIRISYKQFDKITKILKKELKNNRNNGK